MNSDLQAQTQELTQLLTQLHRDLTGLHITLGVVAMLLMATFLIVAFRRI